MNVLIVDADLGFAFWLGQKLGTSGYDAFPAKDVTAAAALVNQLRVEPDLLILNPVLRGSGGFADAMRRRFPRVKILAALEDPRQQWRLPFADGFARKVYQEHSYPEAEWLETIREVMLAGTVVQ